MNVSSTEQGYTASQNSTVLRMIERNQCPLFNLWLSQTEPYLVDGVRNTAFVDAGCSKESSASPCQMYAPQLHERTDLRIRISPSAGLSGLTRRVNV